VRHFTRERDIGFSGTLDLEQACGKEIHKVTNQEGILQAYGVPSLRTLKDLLISGEADCQKALGISYSKVAAQLGVNQKTLVSMKKRANNASQEEKAWLHRFEAAYCRSEVVKSLILNTAKRKKRQAE
jgi:hypothetical protein